uniref:Mating type protein MAT1-2-1 n=1 Tax=Clarireedia homoeocarpa TaxID=1436886 RepID=F2XFZ4_9HELO|nr:mating type protein MAT1-2-1 [Clarireedia homoeocarpa]
MSLSKMAASGGLFLQYPHVPSEENSVLKTPLADVPFPPNKDTVFGDYGIEGLTEALFENTLMIWQSLEISHATDLNPYMEWSEGEFFSLGAAGRQLLLHLFQQHTGYEALTCRYHSQPRHIIGPIDFFNDKMLLPVFGFTNICFLPMKVDHEMAISQFDDEDDTDVNLESLSALSSPAAPQLPASSSITTRGKIPRPPNEWILYRADNHLPIKLAYPGISNNEISSITAGMWAAESKDRREKYKKRALVLKENHAKAYPNYKYSPRKPSEKKRRVSKKSLAKNLDLQQAAESYHNAATYVGYPAASHSFTSNVSMEHYGVNGLANHTSVNNMEQQGRIATSSEQERGYHFNPALSFDAAQQQDHSTFFYGSTVMREQESPLGNALPGLNL